MKQTACDMDLVGTQYPEWDSFAILYPDYFQKTKNVESTCRILVVDEYTSERELLESLLRSLSCQVVCVSDGLMALGRFYYDPKPFDLVISGINIPGVNGNILARHIQNSDKPITVIAFTSEIKQVGNNFHEVINKPFNSEGVKNMIKRFLPDPMQNQIS